MFSLSPRRFHSLLLAPALLPFLLLMNFAAPDNHPPVAVPDHYTVHGTFSSPPDSGVLSNDSDPDGDPLTCVFARVDTSLGTAIVNTNGRADFIAAYGQTGTVTIPYTVCDNHNACSSSTVTFDVVNQPPVANSDDYTVHGVFSTPLIDPAPYGVLKNDSDSEGDSLSCLYEQVQTSLGVATVYPNGKADFVESNNGQTGAVSITYTVCDNLRRLF